MRGARAAKGTGSAGEAEGLPQAPSAKSAGTVTRNAAKPGELPELLQVLSDFLVTLQGAGQELSVHNYQVHGQPDAVVIVLRRTRIDGGQIKPIGGDN